MVNKDVSIKVTVPNASAGIGPLLAMQRRLRNLEPTLAQIGGMLESRVNLRFDTKTDPDGKPWRPWQPATAKARAEERRGTLLEYTGAMRASLRWNLEKHTLTVGFGVDYVKRHEQAKNPNRLRRILTDSAGQISAGDEAAVMRMLNNYINGA